MRSDTPFLLSPPLPKRLKSVWDVCPSLGDRRGCDIVYSFLLQAVVSERLVIYLYQCMLLHTRKSALKEGVPIVCSFVCFCSWELTLKNTQKKNTEISLCRSSCRRGWGLLFSPSRLMLGHKQHLLSLQFLLNEQLSLSCVMKQMYSLELAKAWNVPCIW